MYKGYYGDLNSKIFFIFFIFVHRNSHKVVVFCGWSLKICQPSTTPVVDNPLVHHIVVSTGSCTLGAIHKKRPLYESFYGQK